MRKDCSSDREKLLKFEAKGREFAKNLRSLNRTIYSNSESNLSLEVSPNKSEQLEFKFEKTNGI